MTKGKYDEYQCIRCGYETSQKPRMRLHLYARKKSCPAISNDIELTDVIKEHILNNRFYTIPKESKHGTQKMINQTINYNNTINNYVANMDILEKIAKYAAHTKLPHIGFEDHIRIKYEDDAEYLRNPRNLRVESVAMNHDDICMVIDSATKASQTGDRIDYNILYDNFTKRIRLYEDGEWVDSVLSYGLRKLIKTLQDHYLNDYEKYLIKKHENPTTHFGTKALIRDLIREYYKFISAFDRDPWVKGKSNNQIIDGGYEFTIEETFMKIYRMPISNTECKKIQKEVIDILKGNTKRNIEELNKKVINLIHMDDGFKERMFSTHSQNNLALLDELDDSDNE